MADCFVQGSFAITCTHCEMALLGEAFEASYAFEAGTSPDDPSPALLAAFPPIEAEDPWSGFLAIFPDPDFPSFGVDFDGLLDQQGVQTVFFYSMTDFQPDALARLIRHCCQETLRQAPIGFEWACSCSQPRIGLFSGGACAIFPDRVMFGTTAQMLAGMLGAEMNDSLPPGFGSSDDIPDCPLADWQTEVANGDTRLG